MRRSRVPAPHERGDRSGPWAAVGCLLAACGPAVAGAAAADAAPALGPEFVITQPARDVGLAGSAQGRFVVVWSTEFEAGEMVGRLYRATGDTTDFAVGEAYEYFTDAKIAFAADDGFVVVWQLHSHDPATFLPRMRLYDADAVARTDQIPTTDGLAVTRLADDRYAAIGISEGHFYDRNGNASGNPFATPWPPTSDIPYPALAPHPDGGFVLAWNDERTIPGDDPILAQRFSPAGEPLTARERVDDQLPLELRGSPSIVADDDGFLVAWHARADGAEDYRIRAKTVDASGLPVGTELALSVPALGSAVSPGPATSGGETLLVWSSELSAGTDDSGSSIQARFLAASGQPVSAPFQVNESTLGDQWRPLAAGLGQGRFVVVWREDDYGLRGRILEGPLFADGFESGDTSAWSATVP